MTNSYQAGIEAAKLGHSIDNSHPFNHQEFVQGYKSIKPNASSMFDFLSKPEDKLKMLEIIELVEKS